MSQRLPDYCIVDGVVCEVIEVRRPVNGDGVSTPLYVNLDTGRIYITRGDEDPATLLRQTARDYGVDVIIPQLPLIPVLSSTETPQSFRSAAAKRSPARFL